MYYRIAIVTRDDPYAYGPVWDTYEQLKLAGHAVEIVDARQVPGLIDGCGEVNENLFARFREVFRPDYVACKGETAEEVLAALAATDAGTSERARHFVVFGYLGRDNFGDELIFQILHRELSERYPNSYTSVIGDGPAGVLARHGVASVWPNDKASVRALLNGADALLFMAGLMFDEPVLNRTSGMVDIFQNPLSEIPGQAACVLLAHMCDVPSVFIGIGAGPLANPDSQRLVQLESLARPRYLTRDAHTAQLLREAGVDPALVKEAADMAFLLDPVAYTSTEPESLSLLGLADEPYAVVALRSYEGTPEDYPARIAAALDHLYETQGIRPLFLNFSPEDRDVHLPVIKAMRHGSLAAIRDTIDADETLRLIAHARISFAMRLHCSILANLFGVPAVGLDYLDKVGDFFAQMDASQLALPLDAAAEDMTAALDAALAAPVNAGQVTENQRIARAAFGELCALVDGREAHPVPQQRYPRSLSAEGVELARARKDLEDTRAYCAQLEARLAELEGSTAWKAGRALTAPARALKDALRR